jgi:hypothetical protein
MDLKKAAMIGAVGGIIASIATKKGRGKMVEHAVKYAALGAGVMAAGSYAMRELGTHHAGFQGIQDPHEFGLPYHSPLGSGQGGNWGHSMDQSHFRRW